MDKEVQDRLIEKCKTIVESKYHLEVPIRMADIHDSMIKQGIPFNILYKAYYLKNMILIKNSLRRIKNDYSQRRRA